MTTLAFPARAARSVLTPLLAAVAVASGRLLRLLARGALFVPGVAGAGLVSWGAWLVYRPAGFMVGGLFLLAVDRQVTFRRGRGDD